MRKFGSNIFIIICLMPNSNRSLHIHQFKNSPPFLLAFQLLKIAPAERLSTLDELRRHPYMADVNFDQVFGKETKPSFVPAVGTLSNIMFETISFWGWQSLVPSIESRCHLCSSALITLCVFKVALSQKTQDILRWVHLKVI